jgi:preprotein translocase subunit SecE
MTSQSVTAKTGKPRFQFFSGIIGELRKVVWLTRREMVYLTAMVLIVAVLAGALLGGFDYGFSKMVDKLILGS